jgi:hypothetical protein
MMIICPSKASREEPENPELVRRALSEEGPTRPPVPLKPEQCWTGGEAKAAQYLLGKCKDLSSNTSPTKKRKKKVQN